MQPLQLRSGRSAQRRTAGPDLPAAQLAHLLLLVCARGIEVRARGACLGESLTHGLRIEHEAGARYARTGPGSRELLVLHQAPQRTRQRYAAGAMAATHARLRHDRGCSGFGVALAELERLAAAWGRQGEQAYLLDGFRAAAEFLAEAPEWSGGLAEETLTHEVTALITPAAPTGDTVRRLSGERKRRAPRA